MSQPFGFDEAVAETFGTALDSGFDARSDARSDTRSDTKNETGRDPDALRVGWARTRAACATWLRRQWARRPAAQMEKLRLVHSLGLGERRSVFILAVEGRRFLVGSTPQSVTLLAELRSDTQTRSRDAAIDTEARHSAPLHPQDIPSEDIPAEAIDLRIEAASQREDAA